MSDRGALGDLTDSLPSDFRPIAFEQFQGLNTQSPRPAIEDSQMAWSDGFMPYGKVLRILPGVGQDYYTADVGTTVVWQGFGNISDTPYGIVVQSDGSIWAFTNPGDKIAVMPAGTILAPSTILGFSQWGSKYLIFSKDQNNGYWLWDGINLFMAGTLGPEVSIDNAGENYDGSAPTFIFQTTGSGTGATFSAIIDNNSITKVTVTNPGSGFSPLDQAALVVQGGGSDNQAYADLIVPVAGSGGVDQVIIANGGSSYTYRAQVTFTGGGGTGATASATIVSGTITAIAIINPGKDYTSAPTVGITDPGVPTGGGTPIPGGTGFSGFCSISFGQITDIIIADGGSGYISAPTLKIVGDGTGASGIVQIDSTGVVTGVIMQNYGKGYTGAIAVFEGGNFAANVTPMLMPFGISGTEIEVAFDRVWVTNGSAASDAPPKNRTIFSSSGSPVDFGGNGGAFGSNDSFLRVGYHGLKQSNGFLYLIGDSSINAISGVQTNTSSTTGVAATATTTFSNQNIDPQLGTPWPASIQVLSRNIIFANTLGVFALSGGAATRISEALDGFYGSGPIFGQTANFSAAVANIFNEPVFMLLLPVFDPILATQVNKLLLWDGRRWFTSQQDKVLTFIATQELNSVMTAWGTDGTHVFPLFKSPTTGFIKTARSKLFSPPAYWTTKSAMHLQGVARGFPDNSTILVSIDNEGGIGTGNALYPVPAASPSEAVLVFGPNPVSQAGRMMGFTISTIASEGDIMSIGLVEQVETVNA